MGIRILEREGGGLLVEVGLGSGLGGGVVV